MGVRFPPERPSINTVMIKEVVMQLKDKSMLTWADIIENEILDDDVPWYLTERAPGNHNMPFAPVQLKFLLKNFNHYYFSNMVSVALNRKHFNPALPNTLKFCREALSIGNLVGCPFGKIIIWKVPPGKTATINKATTEYQQCVVSSLFILTNSNAIDFYANNTIQTCEKGDFFQYTMELDFIQISNHSTNDFYFLTFDVWNRDKLDAAAKQMDPNEWLNKNPERLGSALNPKISKMLYIDQYYGQHIT